MRSVFPLALLLAAAVSGWSASKPHVVALGKAQQVKIFVGAEEAQVLSISVRPLYVDTKLKEFTTGYLHDVTDRLFVVQRAFRINDGLPDDKPRQSKWVWQRGGWMLVDRGSGHITQLRLPDFDPSYSDISWYRDYAAYCGISESGERAYTVVAQVGGHKPVYRKELSKAPSETTGAGCAAAHWERHPARVTFQPNGGDPFTVNVRTRQVNEPQDSAAE